MRETWYVLEDGSSANPVDVAPDKDGVLRHKGGMAVAIGPHGNHRSRGVDVDAELARVSRDKPSKKQQAKESPPQSDRQMTADDADTATYKTR